MIDLFACCRLCLKQDDTVAVNCLDITELCAAVKGVFGFEIARNDKCTTRLCRECTYKVTTFAMYRDTVLNNQKSLEQYIILNEKISKNPEIIVKAEETDDDDVVFVENESIGSSSTKKDNTQNKKNISTRTKNANSVTRSSINEISALKMNNTKRKGKKPPKLFARKRTSAILKDVLHTLIQRRTRNLKVRLRKINFSQLNKFVIHEKDRKILENDIKNRKEKDNKNKLQSELLTPFGAKVLQNLIKTKPSTSSGVGTIQELISTVTKQPLNKSPSLRELLVKATNEAKSTENSQVSKQVEQILSAKRTSANTVVPQHSEFNLSPKEYHNSRNNAGIVITKVHANIQKIGNILTPTGSRTESVIERNKISDRSAVSLHVPQQNSQRSNVIYKNPQESSSSSFTNRPIINQHPAYSSAGLSVIPPMITGVYSNGPQQLPNLQTNNSSNDAMRNNPLLLQQLSRTPTVPFQHTYNNSHIVIPNQQVQVRPPQLQPPYQHQVPFQHQMGDRLPTQRKSLEHCNVIRPTQQIPVSTDEYLPMEAVLGRRSGPQPSATVTSNSQVAPTVTSTTATPPPQTPANPPAPAESNNADTRVKVLSVKELNMRAAESKKLPIRITLVKIKNEVQIKLTDSKNSDIHYKDLTTPEQMAVKASLLEPQSRQQILNAIKTCNPDQYSRNMLRCFGISPEEIF